MAGNLKKVCYVLIIFAFIGQSYLKMADLLTETYERIRLRLKAGAGQLLSDVDAAEDALQDAFVKLGRYRVGSEREAEALLTRTVRNVSIDQLRKRKTVPLDGDLAEEEAGMDRETQFRRVERMVEQELTDLQRLIIRKHEYEGLTLEAVAQELGMQPPAVRMQLSRARKTLREKYRKQYHEE